MSSPISSHSATPVRMWILHVAFINAVLIYAVLTLFLHPPAAPPRAVNTDLVFGVVLIVSILQIAAAYRLPGLMGDAAPDRSAAARTEAASDAMDRRQVAMILSDSIIEITAIYGLVGWMLGWFETWQFLAILGAAAFGLAGMVPRIAGWISEYEQMKRREAATAANPTG